MSNTKAKLLIVEDEQAILHGLIDVFVFHGYEVDAAEDGKIGLEKALTLTYDLILLDVMLPFIDGFSICNQIREKDLQQPIIMLTAKSSEQDIITGLSLGADDYISKPFSVRELVLRVECVLKRTQKNSPQNAILSIGSLRIDTANLQTIETVNPQKFTRREIEILAYLQQQHHRPVPREELLEKVWGYRRAENIETRTVDIHIAKLRRKIETDPKQPQLLLTIRGEGYRLMTDASA
ncbi:MAG: response regulator [Methyloprofundus sp.]|nr:response regulator [Methyloprofundus sp.]